MKNSRGGLLGLHDLFVKLASYLQSPLLLVVRLYWGWLFAQDGWAKLHNLSGVTDFFTSLNLPFPHLTAIFISTIELVGGILLALGLLSRLTGLALTINMAVAYITADREALLSVFSDPEKFYNATPYTFLFAALLILVFGPGLFSLDTLFARRFKKPPAGNSIAA
ncbi:MAG: DoxX family protein [Candidatus Acidiferrales bacterium]